MLSRLSNDEPTTEDQLGHQAQVEEVAGMLDRVEPPYVLGVHGDWGMGKTSFLRKLEARIGGGQGARKSRVLFFEAWRHQFEEQPVVALLQAIREHFGAQRRAWDKAGKLAEVAVWTGLRLLDDLSQGVVQAARAEGEAWEQRNLAVPLGSESFRSAFEAAIEKLTGRGESRLVVLIDDLDRCGDLAVVRLLEGLKLYLNARNCVFVIAADRRAIVRAIHRQLFQQGSARDAEEYAEKLFQAVVPLRRVGDLGAFLRKHWASDSARGDRLVELQRQHAFLAANPRKIKRFLVELQERMRAAGDDTPFELLVAVQAIQTYHPDLYRILEAEPEFWEVLGQFVQEPEAVQHEALADLRLPYRTGPAPTAAPASAFHDPADPRVFRVALLLRQLDVPTKADLPAALLLGTDGAAGTPGGPG